MTEPGYFRRQRYQLVVPLLDPEIYHTAPGDVILGAEPWLTRVLPSSTAALAAVGLLQTVFHPTEIQDVMPTALTEASMSRIDAALLKLFGL